MTQRRRWEVGAQATGTAAAAGLWQLMSCSHVLPVVPQGLLADGQVQAHGAGDLAVEHQHQRGADGAERVGTSALEQRGHALLLRHLGEAVQGALVQPLGLLQWSHTRVHSKRQRATGGHWKGTTGREVAA